MVLCCTRYHFILKSSVNVSLLRRPTYLYGFARGIWIDSESVYSEEVTLVVRIGDGSRIITVFLCFLANKGLGGSSDMFGGSGMSDSMSDSEWLSGETWFFCFFWLFLVDTLELRDEIVSNEIPVIRVFLASLGSTPMVSSTLFRYRSYRSFVQHNGASKTSKYTFHGQNGKFSKNRSRSAEIGRKIGQNWASWPFLRW